MRSESRSSIGKENKVMAMKFVRSTGNLEFYGSKSKEIYQSSTATTEDHSQKRNPCFDPVGGPPRPLRTIVKISFGLEVLNLPPDIQEILQHLRMRCRWPKILLATVVKLISLLDKIVTGAQMGVISLIMRGIGQFTYRMYGCNFISLYVLMFCPKLSKANTSQCFFLAGVLYIKRKRFCRGDPVEMDHHNLQCSPSLIKIFQRSTA
ncbi:hypothetical protein F2Q70_00032396 [Brassica cretica]|uniref:Uncharacterized protein n=1 Tax=Brassica cretica TaxID=69181 RepID=A0A8S9H3I1_BRACR|nr:hypothetical protein F2Q70_00032396 [Brassica cretica]KAF2551616.1 hypothetical protein F2Q68_00036779 [Brassica cretica]